MIDVFLKVLRWQMMPIEAKLQSYVAFAARSRLQIPPDHSTDMTLRVIRLRTSVTQNLFTRKTCIKLENPFLWQFFTKNFHFGITRKLQKCSFTDRSMDNNHHRHRLLVTRGRKQNELRKSKLL